MSGRPPGGSDEDLDGFLDEVRDEGRKILERYGISGSRGVEIVSHCYVLTALSEGTRAARRRQFLEAVENACQELRAQLGPPEEEVEDEPVH